MARPILAHTALPLGRLFITCLSLLFLDPRGWQHMCRLSPAHHAKACVPFFVLEIFKFKYGKFFIKNAASISKFKWFEQPWLKQANITLAFKNGESYSKDKYRSVSTLPNLSKIFEWCMFHQINEYMDVFLSRHHNNVSLPCLKSGDLL